MSVGLSYVLRLCVSGHNEVILLEPCFEHTEIGKLIFSTLL